MAKRRFNWKLAVVLVLALIVLGFTVTGLRIYQRTKQAENALQTGILAYEEERWGDAATSLGQYIVRHRDDVEILLKYANAQLYIRPQKRETITQAISAFRAILRQDPSNQEAIESLTQLYLAPDISLPGEAELVAARYISLNPDAPPEIHLRLAQAQIGLDKTVEAAGTLEQTIETHRDFVSAYETIGYLAEQNPRDVNYPASHWFDQAVAKNPQSPAALLARAEYFLRQSKESQSPEDLSAIKRDMEQAEAIVPGQIKEKIRLAALWLALRKPERAEPHLTAVRVEEEDNPALWQYLAYAAKGYDSKEKMAQVAEDGLAALEGKQESFLYNAAELFILAERPDRAQDCIDKMSANENIPINVAYLQGWLLQNKEEYRAAIAQYRRVLELELDIPSDRSWPHDEHVRRLLVDSLQRVGDSDASLIELQNLVSKYPRTFDYRMMLARALAGRQRWEEARSHAREASYLDPDNPDVALLELGINIDLLSTDADAPENAWADIESRLDEIATERGEDEKIARYRRLIAMGKKDFSAVEAKLGPEPDPNTVDHKQWVISAAELDPNTLDYKQSVILHARFLSDRGYSAEAEKLLQQGTTLYPDNIQMVGEFERYYLVQGNIGSAIEVLKEAAENATKFEARKQFSLELVKLYDANGQGDLATNQLEKLRQEEPNDIQVLRGLLRRRAIITDTEKAQGIVDLVREIEGEDGLQWRFEQALLWLSSETFGDRRGEITQLLEEVLRANPADQVSRELLADVQASSGNMQLAVSTYREALDRDPDNIRIIQKTVKALMSVDPEEQLGMAQRYEEALAMAQRGLARKPADAYLLLQQVNLMEKLGRRRNTITPVLENLYDVVSEERYTAEEPNKVRVGAKLAGYLIDEQRYEDANDILNSLEGTTPDAPELMIAWAESHLARDQVEDAIANYDRMVEKQQNAKSWVLRARFMSRLDRSEEAADDYERAIKLATDPNEQDRILNEKSEYHRLNENWTQAIQDLDYLYRRYPGNTGLALRLGDLYLKDDKPEKAVALLQEYISRLSDPEATLGPRILLARATYRSGRKAEGKRLFEALDMDNPGTFAILGTYLQTLYEGQDWLKVEEYATRIQETCVDINVGTVLNLINQLVELPSGNENQGKKIQAVLLERVIAKDPLDRARDGGIIKLAQLNHDLGHKDEAKDGYQQVIARTTDLGLKLVAVNNLAWLLGMEQGDLQAAYDLTSEAIKDYPDLNYYDLMDTHGVICRRLEKLDEAVLYLNRCVAHDESAKAKGAGTRFYLGQALNQMDRKAEAKTQLEEARRMNEAIGGLSEDDKTKLNQLLADL